MTTAPGAGASRAHQAPRHAGAFGAAVALACVFAWGLMAGCDSAAPGAGSGMQGTQTAAAIRTQAPPGTAAPLLTAAGMLARPQFEVQAVTPYHTTRSSLYVIGSAKYLGSEVLGTPNVVVSLTDDSGNVVASNDAIYVPQIVRPGMVVPFFVVIDPIPGQWSRTEADISAGPLSDEFRRYYTDQVEVVQSSLYLPAESNQLTAVGHVKNVSGKTLSSTTILGAVYGKTGQVIDVAEGYGDIPVLEAGESSPFHLAFVNIKPEDGVRLEVFATGRLR